MRAVAVESPRPKRAHRADNNERVVDVLHELIVATDRSGWGVRGLADHLGESRSTVNRILMDLIDEGFAVQTNSGAYMVGPRLRVLTRHLRLNPLIAMADVLLSELALVSEATAVLAIYDPPRARGVAVSVIDAPGPVRYRLLPGAGLPLHAGAAGRAILAEVGIEALRDVIPEVFTTSTVTDPDRLAELIEADRRLGYTISVGERFDLAAGVAAPFRSQGLVGAISVTRPREGITDIDLHSSALRVQKVARRLSALPPEEYEHANSGTRLNPHGSAGSSSSTPNTTAGRIAKLITGLVGPECVAHRRKDVSALIDASPATAGKVMATMVAIGIATVWSDRIGPGPKLFHWSAMIGSGSGITDLVDHIVSNLASETRETVGLAEYQPEEGCARFAAIRLGDSQLQYTLTLGERIPLHAGAAGKAVLAYLPIESVVNLNLERYTEHTLSTMAELEPALAEIRERGWATGIGERVNDAYGVAAPYFIDGHVRGSLTVTVPRHRSADIDVALLGERVAAAAAAITQLLSVWTGPDVA